MSQPKTLRRVRREDHPAAERRTDGLEVCLDCWISLMHRDDRDLGAKSQKLPLGTRDDADYESDVSTGDTAQMRRNNEIGEATQAMFQSLKNSHQWAIRRKCGIATVWLYPQLDYLVEAIDACGELEKKLRGNVATRMLFL